MISQTAEQPQRGVIFDCFNTLVVDNEWLPGAIDLLSQFQAQGFVLTLVTDAEPGNTIFTVTRRNCPEIETFFDGRILMGMSLEDRARLAIEQHRPIVDDALRFLGFSNPGLYRDVTALHINPCSRDPDPEILLHGPQMFFKKYKPFIQDK